MISEAWRDTPAVALTLKELTNPMSMTSAQALTQFGIAGELLEMSRPFSVLQRIEPNAMRVPFGATVAIETGLPSVGWVPENRQKPITMGSYGVTTLPVYKTAGATVITLELARMSTPSAEAAIRSALGRSLAKFLDRQFLDPAVALVAGDHPASITNGAIAIASTGTTADTIAADITAMLQALTSWNAPVFILRNSTAAHMAGLPGPAFPQLTTQGGFISGVPVLTAPDLPQTIVLMDQSEILIADDGEATISATNQATVVMKDDPAAADTLTGLWQSDLVGLLIERFISWKRGRDGSVVYMTTSY
jgi:HK97 family phage major capsid protein